MMRKTTLATVITLTASLFASAAMAAPAEVDGGTVNVNGNMVAAACTIEAGTKDQTVSLGTRRLNELPYNPNGYYGTQTPFDIYLTNCNTGISSKATAAFLSVGPTASSDTMYNLAPENPSNLTLSIADVLGYSMPVNGTRSSYKTQLYDSGARMSFYARYTHSAYPAPITGGNTLYALTYKVIFL